MATETAEPGQITPNPEHLAAFVSALVKKRDEAIAGRIASGIETEWLEDEEHYQGIDDANRAHQRSWIASIKRGSSVRPEPAGNRSTVFLNITRPYTDAAAARLADMLLPTAEACFKVEPTPIANVSAEMRAQLAALGIDIDAEQDRIKAESDVAAEAMQEEIEDHLTECAWQGEVRSVIEDAARIGSGVLKGPFPEKRTVREWVRQTTDAKTWPMRIWSLVRDVLAKLGIVEVGLALQTVEEIRPASKRVDPWNFFPDPACGESIHDGSYCFEREYITAKILRDMMPSGPGKSGYRPEAIAEALREGPKASQRSSRESGDGTNPPVDDQYEMWTFYGVIAKDDAVNSGLELDDSTPVAHAMALLVNDKLIKLTLNALDTGEYPYDVLAWQRRPGVPYGMGVARHIRTPQRMLNAACRALMDNAGNIVTVQTILANGVTPEDGNFGFSKSKTWRASPETVDVRGAMWSYVPPSAVVELMSIIEFAREVAEQTTGMPMLLQGQQPQGEATKTLGGMQLLQNNATGVLRRLAKRFDDYLTEPHIRRYYSWLMQHSDREDIKGDLQVNALGSSSLIERDSQKQFLFASMNFATDPAYHINPAKLFAELARSDRMDPTKIQYTEEEFAQLSAGGPSDLDQAKAERERAQAALAEANATLARAQTLFASANVASTVSARPDLAPSADQVARSVGFKDADPPPIIGTAPMGEPLPVDANTSPGFPPVAAPPELPEPVPPEMMQPDADEGAMVGVEGGQR